MSLKMIQDRLNEYHVGNQLEEEHALKEITQEIALAGLSRSGFFKIAVFQGGTALRILYGLNRYSEDLDFALHAPSSEFQWAPYLKSLQTELSAYGYQISVHDREQVHSNVKDAFLKEDSIGKVLLLNFKAKTTVRSMRIKLEIHTCPPEGGSTEMKFLDFPVSVPILTQTLPTLFAGKCHALLSRPWEKGRDWYDFRWYVGKKVQPDFLFLSHALNQAGPWKNQGLQMTAEWLLANLNQKILGMDWNHSRLDITRFLKQSDQDLVSHWNADFFLSCLAQLRSYL